MSSGTGNGTLARLYNDRFGEPLTSDEVYGYWLFVSSAILAVLGVGTAMAGGEASAARTIGVGLAGIGIAGTLTGLIFGQSYRDTAKYLAYIGVVVSIAAVVWFGVSYPDGWSWSVGEGTTVGVFLLYLIGTTLITMSGVIAPAVVGPNQARLEAEAALRETRNELERREREVEEYKREVEEREEELEERERELEEAREEAEAQRSRATEAEQEAVTQRNRAEEAKQEAEAQRARAEEAEQKAEAARARVLEIEQEAKELEAELEKARAEAEESVADIDRMYESKGTFQLYEDTSDKWRWRLVHQNANIIATSGQGYSSDRSARKGMRSVKRNALGADVIWERDEEEPEPESEPVREEPKATFERYRGADDKQRWRLRHDNGRIIAAAARGFSSGSSAKNNIESVRTYITPANYLKFDPAAFEVFEDASGEYRWRLVHRNGTIIGVSSEGFDSRPNARRAVEAVERILEDAEVGGEDSIRYEVYEEDGKHHWQLISSDEPIVENDTGYSSRSGATEAVGRFEEYAEMADTLTVGDASIEIYEDNAGDYRWRLRHRNGTIMAKGSRGYSSRSAAVQGINSVKRNAPEAPVSEVGDGSDGADEEAAE